MLRNVVQRLVAVPVVYDLVQRMIGGREPQQRFAAQSQKCSDSAQWVLDVGGGTGRARGFWPASARFLLLDIDMLKITGYRHKFTNGLAILGDGSKMPIAEASMDVVLMRGVVHHVPESLVESFFSESARVLKSGGKLILMEPVAPSSRLVGRLLWRYDRGSFPRSTGALRNVISSQLEVIHWERFRVLHDYLICVASK